MSSGNCFEKNCSGNCCDYYGNCPNPSSSSLYQNQCWYYYSTKTSTTCQGVVCSSAGSLVGGIVGGVVGLIIIIVIIVACYRRYKANQTVNNQITPNQCGQISATTWNPQAYPGPPVYDQTAYNQTAYNQAAYNQAAYNQGIYNQSPYNGNPQVYPAGNVMVNGGMGYPQGGPVHLGYA